MIEIKTDPINSFQNTLRHAVHKNRILNPGNQKWKYINLKSSSPNFRELLKIHEWDASMRPAMNFRNAPGYNLDKFLTYILESYISIHNAFHVTTPSSLTKDLKDLQMKKKMASLDAKYTKVSTNKVMDIINLILHNNYT